MRHVLALLLIFAFAATSWAAEPMQYTYRAEVAGILCSSCGREIEAALTTLPGVRSVKVTRDPSGGLPRLELTARTRTITQQNVIKALGIRAKTYQIKNFRLMPPPPPGPL